MTRLTFGAKIVACLALSLLAAHASLADGATDNYVFSGTGAEPPAVLVVTTSVGTYDLNAGDQGWFSPTVANTVGNTNYFVGSLSGNGYLDFFTFQTGALSGTITSATLNLNTGSYGLFDGSTLFFGSSSCSSSILDNVAANSACTANQNYSSLLLDPSTSPLPDNLSIDLSSAALTDITAAGGNDFSIVGSLAEPPLSSGGTGLVCPPQCVFRPITLPVFTQHKINQNPPAPGAPIPLPEPSSLLLVGAGIAAVGATRNKRRFA
jgi:PEP-CTERM motif